MPGVPRFSRAGWETSAVVVFVLALPFIAVRAVSDPSPWLHLKIGQFLLDGQRFGSPDPWSAFAAGDYIPTQWLPSMVTALMYDQWGLPAVAWVRAASVLVLFVGLVWLARLVARPSVALLVAGAALVGAWPSLTERPQVAGFVLLLPVIGAWWQTGIDGRPRWWLIPLTWLAASTHGVWATGVVIGALVVAGLIVDHRREPPRRAGLPVLVFGCAAAAAATPLGPGLVVTPFTVGGNARQFVEEWFASSVRTPSVALTLLGLAVVLVVWITTEQRPPWWKIFLLLAAIGLTLLMRRTVAIGAFLAVPLLAEAIETALAERTNGRIAPRPRLRVGEVGAWVAATAAAMLVAVPLATARAQKPTFVPSQLQPALLSLPAGTQIVGQGDITGWLLFAAPSLRPVFDLRVESYSPQHVRRYIAAYGAEPGWDDFISDTKASAALLPVDAPLTAALTEQLNWRVMGTDAGYVLLAQR